MKDGILQSIVPFYIYYNIINIILTKGDVSVHAFLIEKIVVGFFFSLADTNHLQVLQHFFAALPDFMWVDTIIYPFTCENAGLNTNYNTPKWILSLILL